MAPDTAPTGDQDRIPGSAACDPDDDLYALGVCTDNPPLQPCDEDDCPAAKPHTHDWPMRLP